MMHEGCAQGRVSYTRGVHVGGSYVTPFSATPIGMRSSVGLKARVRAPKGIVQENSMTLLYTSAKA